MTDDATVVRWQRPGRRWTLWHLETPTLNDDTGRTGCGKRYPRNRAEHGRLADGALCRSCLRAMGGTQPERAEEVA